MKAAFLAAATASATFTRASVALKQDCSQVAVNVPRYESGKFGQAVMVEEGTTNLVPTPVTLSGWSWSVPGSGITDLGSSFSGGVARNWFQRTTTAGSDHRPVTASGASTYPMTVDKTKAYVVSFEILITQAPESPGLNIVGPVVDNLSPAQKTVVVVDRTTLAATAQNGCTVLTQDTTDDGYRRVTVSIPSAFWTGSGTTCNLQVFNGWNVVGTFDVSLRRLQTEQKEYATSFADGTRAGETLTIPAAGLFTPASGTIECWAYVTPSWKQQVAGRFPYVFSIARTVNSGGTIGLELFHRPDAATWNLRSRDNANNETSVYASDSLTPNGWHHFAVTWSTAALTLYIDGVAAGSAASPKQASAFASDCYIGQGCNSLIDNIRCYTRAITAAEIANVYTGMTPAVADFTAWLAFDSDLSLRTPADTLVFSLSPLRPPRSLSFEQDRRESVGGVPCVRDYVVRNHILDLPLRLTTAEVSLLRTFWRSTVRGMSRPLTYIDVRGDALACRFAQPSLPDIVERAYNSHRTTVKLRAE